MAAIVVANKYTSIVGDLKFVAIVTDANAASTNTYDTGMDSPGGEFGTILHVSLNNTTGTDVQDCTWNNTTGIITLPTISTGVHKLFIVGTN